MQLSGVPVATGDVAAGAMIRVVSHPPPRRLRYGLPIALSRGTTGLMRLRAFEVAPRESPLQATTDPNGPLRAARSDVHIGGDGDDSGARPQP